jgi:hypothetical protein
MPSGSQALAAAAPGSVAKAHVASPAPLPVATLVVKHRDGIWEVTRDGDFHGHYYSQQPAYEAAEAAARGLVADGHAADIQLHDTTGGEKHPDAKRAIAGVRTFEFRVATTPGAR